MPTKTEILNKIKDLGYPRREVAISLDAFFNNKYCEDAIGVNVDPNPPSMGRFYQVFKALLSAKKANQVFVRITDTEEPENWFFSDTIYVIGSLTLAELKAGVKELSPTDIQEGWMYGRPAPIEGIEEGQKVYSVWWD